MAKALTPRQRRFTGEFLIDLNGKQAAIRAGYSPKTAEVQASRLLSNAKVAAAIEKAEAARSQRLVIDADYVLKEYRDVWEAQLTDILTDDWQLRPLSEWPDIWRKMTTPSEVKDVMERSKDGGDASWDKIGELIKCNTFPKAEALKKIGEHTAVRAFQKDLQIDHTGNITFQWQTNEGGNTYDD